MPPDQPRPPVLVRPDGRCVLLVDPLDTEAMGAIARERADRDLYAVCGADDEARLEALHRSGFRPVLRELHVRVPTDPAAHGLERVVRPDGVRLRQVDEVDVGALQVLDETLREDIPGSDGWRWTPEAFRAETFGDDCDPALYLVAEHRDELVGLVRVWVPPQGPRLGCVGVTRPWRRTRLAWFLLRSVGQVLHARGERTVVAEVSDRNTASLGMLRRRGIEPYAQDLTLLRPGES